MEECQTYYWCKTPPWNCQRYLLRNMYFCFLDQLECDLLFYYRLAMNNKGC